MSTIKTKRTITLLSIGIITGFIIGLIKFVIIDAMGHVTANQYIFYKTFRLAALAFAGAFIKWLLLTAAAAFVFLGLVWLVKILFSNIYQKYKSVVNVILIIIFWGVLFVSVGWGINHYWIPYEKFHPISLLADVVILVFSILFAGFLWKILKKDQWKKRFIHLGEKKYLPTAAVSLVVLLLLLNISAFIYTKTHPAKGPNVVFIVIDALRQDHLGCYGYHRDTSPNIDELARRGVIFNHAYSSSPWTKPSVASFFTSLHPNNHRTLSHDNMLPEQPLTLAEVLKNQGYGTYFLTAGNYNIDKKYNFHQGFDYFFNDRIDAAHLTGDFLSLLPKLRNKRFFAYIHYMDPHLPYNKNKYNEWFMKNKPAKPRLEPGKISHKTVKKLAVSHQLSTGDKDYLESLYDGQIKFVDENIKRIIAAFKNNNMLDNTLVVITSDHGEEFWDHHNFEHGHTMYNELLRVPLVIVGNKLKPLAVDTPVRLIDLLPTVIDILNVAPLHYNFKGASFLNLLEGKMRAPGIPIFAMGTLYGDEKYCLIKDNNKIIINTGNRKGKGNLIGPGNKSKLEFYDMTKDPLETENLANTQPENAGRLKSLLDKFIGDQAVYKSKKRTMDKKTKEQLKSLGYL
jgi:arylsulfatase A-like enzyme